MPPRTLGGPPPPPPPPPPPSRPRLEFDVTWNKAQMAAGSAFFAVAAVIIWFAMSRYDVVRLFGVIELEGLIKDLFLGGLALVSGVMAVMFFVALLRSFVGKRLLVLTDDKVVGPAGYMSMRQTSIPLTQIADVKVQAAGKHRFLIITGSNGGKIKLSDQHFRDRGGFDKFLEALDKQMGPGAG